MHQFYPVFLALGAFVSTLSGGLLVVRTPKYFRLVIAFAGGVLVAVPLFDLLPEALTLATGLGMHIEWPMYATGFGFLFLMVLGRFTPEKGPEDCGRRDARHRHTGLIGAVELVMHSFLDGFAIGVGFHLSPHVGFVVALAVIAHDFSDGINTVALTQRTGSSPRVVRMMLMLDALAPVVGASTALFVAIPERFLSLLLAFFSGGFLYLGASDLLPEAREKNPPSTALLFSFSGFVLILMITRLIGVGR